MNLVVFSGNLAKDAKIVTTSTGKQFCVTTLALREDLRPDNKPAVFIDIIIWGERAEKLVQYLTKGKAISITGRLELTKTQKNGNMYITPRVVVDTLEFLGKKTIESVTTESSSEKLSEVSETEAEPLDENTDIPF